MVEFFGFLWTAISGFLAALFQFWIVQAVFAASFAYFLQQIHQTNSNRIIRLEKLHDQKKDVVRSLFKLVDTRLYATRIYMHDLRVQAEWETERNSYKAVVKQWNEEANGHLLYMLTIFPAAFCYKFDMTVFPLFAEADALLGRQRQSIERNELPSTKIWRRVDAIIREIEEVSGALRVEFLNNARKDISIIDNDLTVDSSNYKYLTTLYLFNRLFKTGV